MCPFWVGFDWVAYFFIMVLFSCFLSMPNNFLLDARLNFLPCWVLDIFTFLWEFLSVVPSYGYFFYLNLKFIGISSVLSPVLVNPYCWDKTPPCTNATALLIMGFSRLAGGDKHSPWPSPQTPCEWHTLLTPILSDYFFLPSQTVSSHAFADQFSTDTGEVPLYYLLFFSYWQGSINSSPLWYSVLWTPASWTP